MWMTHPRRTVTWQSSHASQGTSRRQGRFVGQTSIQWQSLLMEKVSWGAEKGGCMDGTMWVTVPWFRPLFRRSRQFDLKIGARAQPRPYIGGPLLCRHWTSSSKLFLLSLSSIDIYIWLFCILIFGSNIVGPTCSREGRAGEAGRRDAKAIQWAAAADGRGPPEADGGVTVGPQSAVCLRASLLGKPWSRGGATDATPSTTAGATPSTTTDVLSSTRSTGRYFSGELLWTLLFFYSSDLDWLHTHAENLVHSFMSIWPRVVRHHMACVRPSSREKIFIVWPDLHVVAFLAGSEYLTVQGRCCRNF
jgi:hypothetical protein